MHTDAYKIDVPGIPASSPSAHPYLPPALQHTKTTTTDQARTGATNASFTAKLLSYQTAVTVTFATRDESLETRVRRTQEGGRASEVKEREDVCTSTCNKLTWLYTQSEARAFRDGNGMEEVNSLLAR